MTPDRGSHLAKYGAAALLLGLYAAVASWIVAGEGQAYRKNLPAGRSSKAEAKPPTPASESPGAPAPPGLPGPKTAMPLVEDRTPIPRPVDAPGTLAKAQSSTPTPALAPVPPIDPFWEQPEQEKIWDLDRLTTEAEQSLGLALNRMVRKFHPPLKVGPLPKRLEDAAEPYLKTCARKDVKYTFTVLDCECANVFSHPGGYIYACRGLFDFIAEDEDYALEFALAHEMAHVDLAHAVNCLRDPEVKKLKLGTVPLFYLVVIPWGYKPEQDLEADRWAWERMAKLDRSRYESLAFLRKLDDYSKKNGFSVEPLKPTEDPPVPMLDNHIRTHPIPRKRLRALMGPAAKT